MSDDRASRLRERRRSSKARADDATRTDETNPAEDAEESESLDEARSDVESNERADPEAASAGSVKEEQVGTYMYLPESQKRELSRVFNVTKAEFEYEFDAEFEKNRHFYPLLVQFGIETLDDASAVEVRQLLDELDQY